MDILMQEFQKKLNNEGESAQKSESEQTEAYVYKQNGSLVYIRGISDE